MTKPLIAIHTGSGMFWQKWIEYCELHDIRYKLVDCFDSNVMDDLLGCRALLWHWPHHDLKAALCAKQLTVSLEQRGVAVFPSTATAWHYDDKVGQKYLLEAIGAPLVPTYVFYDKSDALAWARTAAYPKVWKLRGGAGSENVRLVQNFSHAKALIGRSFGKGWKRTSRLHSLNERVWHFRRDRSLAALLRIPGGLVRAIYPHQNWWRSPIERGYVYFQEFIPGNTFDVRVIVIGARAFAIKRHTREGDFRASGSGRIGYEPSSIPIECVKLSFELAQKLGSQCVAFDYVFHERKVLLVEISYAFTPRVYTPCPGYWDRTLEWHEGKFVPEWFMIEDVLRQIDYVQQGSM